MKLGNALAPLLESQAFRSFLDTVRNDLAATKERRMSTPLELNHSPAYMLCAAMEDYQQELLTRVEDKVRIAKAIAIDESSPDEPAEI